MYQPLMPQHATICHKLAIDAGNRHIKVVADNGLIKQMPSYLAKANFRDADAISYEGGDRTDLVGERWLVGNAAKHRNGEAIFYSEKADLMPKVVLGILPLLGSGSVNIASLRLCLPDIYGADSKALTAALKGTHQINGDTFRIGSISVRNEAICSYQFLLNSGIFKYARPNGILDIGGGNTTGVLITPEGDPIWDSKFTSYGAIELAKMVASHPDLVGLESKGLSPRLDLILDAIASADRRYGSGKDIGGAIDACLPDFLNKVKAQMTTAWEPYLSSIGEIAIIGGSAPLFREWSAKNPRIKVCLDAQFANAKGMLCG